jgi:hypothetical protein
VNDTFKGNIPYSSVAVNFDSDSLIAKTLLLKLHGGKHPMLSKDQYGYIKTDLVLTIKRKKNDVITTIGNVKTESSGDDIILELNFN